MITPYVHHRQNDTLTELTDLPQSDVGAPAPVVICNEQATVLSYWLRGNEDYSALPEQLANVHNLCMIRFEHCRNTRFGGPNDEALSGHPLASRGLKAYAAFEVRNSSWVRIMDQINSVHERHNPEAFGKLKHYILTFHDSMFECVAESYRFWTLPAEENQTAQINAAASF